MAQLGSVLAWGARGRRFKSCYPDLANKKVSVKHFYRDFFYGGYSSLHHHWHLIQSMDISIDRSQHNVAIGSKTIQGFLIKLPPHVMMSTRNTRCR